MLVFTSHITEGKYIEILERLIVYKKQINHIHMKTLLLMLAATLGIAFSGLATDNKSNRINPNDLVNIAFFGTEPFWNLNFTENGINFKTMNGEETSMWYARYGTNYNNQLQGAGEYDSNNNLVIIGISGHSSATITISSEECNDGMSENIYAYSISISWLDESPPLKGCGRVKDSKTILNEKMGKLEGELDELLKRHVNEVEDAYFYTRDIKDHALYKESKHVRNFVDKLFRMGYDIKQEEGRYYLYIGEPTSYTFKEPLLEEEIARLEEELNELLYNLRNKVKNASFYPSNIQEHALYKETDAVRTFVDKLLETGYYFTQEEGRYYVRFGEQKENHDEEPLPEEEMVQLERELNELLKSLVNEVENANYYPNDIKEHALYKKTDPVRAFVDKLFRMGYGIEQAEGSYYLYISKPNNYTDGEIEN